MTQRHTDPPGRRTRPLPTPAAPLTPKQAAACCSPIDGLLRPDLFAALCDPTRARLLACLIKCARPASVTELGQCCSVDLSVVSRHLQHLGRAGIITAERDGRTVLYTVQRAALCHSLRALADAIDAHYPTTTDTTPAAPARHARTTRNTRP